MHVIKINQTSHIFVKQNLVTLFDRKGQYDILVCALCGLKGKARRIGYIDIDGKIKNPSVCLKAVIPKKIKIINCYANGKVFGNLKCGTIHNVIKSPDDKYKNGFGGVWVMGIGEPVRVLFDEYKTIE